MSSEEPSQREVYCQELAKHGDVTIAGSKAGYTPETARTLQYRPNVRERVRELCAQRLAFAVPKAVARLEELLDADVPGVTIQAIREVLSRGGLPETQSLQVERKQSHEEQLAELGQLFATSPEVRALLRDVMASPQGAQLRRELSDVALEDKSHEE